MWTSLNSNSNKLSCTTAKYVFSFQWITIFTNLITHFFYLPNYLISIFLCRDAINAVVLWGTTAKYVFSFQWIIIFTNMITFFFYLPQLGHFNSWVLLLQQAIMSLIISQQSSAKWTQLTLRALLRKYIVSDNFAEGTFPSFPIIILFAITVISLCSI